MPTGELKGLLTDIGTEELAHFEMIGAMVYQLTRNLSCEEIKKNGFDAYFVDHTAGVYAASAAGNPWTASYVQTKGDVLADLHEDLAAEGTITKEQPDITTPEKALFHAGSRDFGGLAQKRRLRPHKNNKSLNTIGQAVFKEKYDRLTTGLSDRQ